MQKINSFIFSAFIYGISTTLALAQTAALLPNALQQFFDQNGDPLSGGSVTFYFPSTSNLKPVWQDVGESTPYTNPVILNAAGEPPSASGIYGQGTYRQVVKDINGNIIWDAVTAAPGTSTNTGTGDGDLVGTVKPWAGINAPNQYLFAAGQQISRTTFSALFTAITQTLPVVCASGNNTLTGISDTSSINIGKPIEVTCVVPGTTVVSKTSSTVVMSNPSTVNLNTNATFFPFGNGDGSTTFTIPDFRGNVIAGRPNMGGTASTNLTNAFCANATAQGAVCGSQSATHTLLQAELPAIKPPITITDPGHVHGPGAGTAFLVAGINNVSVLSNTNGGTAATTASATTGITAAFTSNLGSGTAFTLGTVQPTMTLNYIIKVTPDANSAIATGVTDINGMVGSIACGSGLTCSGNTINVTAAGGTVNAGVAGQLAYYATSSTILSGNANIVYSSGALTIGTGTSLNLNNSISWLTMVNTSPSITWALSFNNAAAIGSNSAIQLTSNGVAGNNIYFGNATGVGNTLWLWAGSPTLTVLPSTGLYPGFALNGDMLVNDIWSGASNPMTLFKRINTGLAITARTNFNSSQNGTASDTDGGSTISMGPLLNAGGAVNDGNIQLSAYGIGTGAIANSVRIATRSTTGVVTDRMIVQSSGHIYEPGQSAATTVGTCGTSPSFNGSDTIGHVTMGSGSTSCTITFGAVFATTPICLVVDQTGVRASMSYIVSTSAIVVSGATASDVLNYLCRATS